MIGDAPCEKCGYNGPGYYSAKTHPCIDFDRSIDLDRDLEEARAILEGRSMLLCEVRHLRALQVHFEDTLIVLAMKAAKFHDDIMAVE